MKQVTWAKNKVLQLLAPTQPIPDLWRKWSAVNTVPVSIALVNTALFNAALVNKALVNKALVNKTLVNKALVNKALVNAALVNAALIFDHYNALLVTDILAYHI